MKMKITFTAMLLAFLLSPITAEASADGLPLYEARIAWQGAEVYAQPSAQSPIVGSLHYDDLIQFYTELNPEGTGYFAAINYNGAYAYVPAGSISRHPVADTERVPASSHEPYGFIDLEGNLLSNSYLDLLNTYMLLPENIRVAFQTEGFRIKMTEQYIADEVWASYGGVPDRFAFTHVCAAFDYATKMLYINDEDTRYVLHEMGHYVNDRLGMFSDRQENIALWASEKGKLTYYALSDQREWYAECFDLYFRCPQLLIIASPQSYEMVTRSLSEFTAITAQLVSPWDASANPSNTGLHLRMESQRQGLPGGCIRLGG